MSEIAVGLITVEITRASGDLFEQELWPPPYLGIARAVPEYTSSFPLSTLPPFVRAGSAAVFLCAEQVPTLTRLIYCRFLIEVHPSCTSFCSASVTPDIYRPAHGGGSRNGGTNERPRGHRFMKVLIENRCYRIFCLKSRKKWLITCVE